MSRFSYSPKPDFQGEVERKRKKNPRSKINSGKSSVLRNSKNSITKRSEYDDDKEGLINEKYQLLCEISNMRDECADLNQELLRKEAELMEHEANEEYLRRHYEASLHKDEGSYKKMVISAKLTNLQMDLEKIDKEYKVVKSRVSKFNKKKLMSEISDQMDQMFDLQRENYALLSEYKSICNQLHYSDVAKSIRIYQKQHAYIDQLQESMVNEKQKEIELKRKINDIVYRNALSIDKEAEYDRIKSQYRKIRMAKNIKLEELENLKRKQLEEISLIKDLIKRQKVDQKQAEERRKFSTSMQNRGKLYQSRPPNQKIFDDIEYMHSQSTYISESSNKHDVKTLTNENIENLKSSSESHKKSDKKFTNHTGKYSEVKISTTSDRVSSEKHNKSSSREGSKQINGHYDDSNFQADTDRILASISGNKSSIKTTESKTKTTSSSKSTSFEVTKTANVKKEASSSQTPDIPVSGSLTS